MLWLLKASTDRRVVARLVWILTALATPAEDAVAAPAEACRRAISQIEAEATALPAGLLGAVALTESARRLPGGDRTVPWPWTINSPAGAFYLDDRDAAVAKVEALKRAGHRNIDIGCMQINLRHHPDAFASLDEAFDPAANVAYAARFLATLKDETPHLFEAVGYYHSRTPERSRAYAQRVYRHWGKTPPPAQRPPVTDGAAVIYRADANAPGGWRRESVGRGDESGATTHRRVLRRSGFDDWAAGRPPWR